MINLSEFKEDKVRKIIEFETEDDIKEVVIENPTQDFINKFFSEGAVKEGNNASLEYLLENLTNIKLDMPLSELLDSGRKNVVLDEVIKELTILLGEMNRKFVINLNTLIEINNINKENMRDVEHDIQ